MLLSGWHKQVARLVWSVRGLLCLGAVDAVDPAAATGVVTRSSTAKGVALATHVTPVIVHLADPRKTAIFRAVAFVRVLEDKNK